MGWCGRRAAVASLGAVTRARTLLLLLSLIGCQAEPPQDARPSILLVVVVTCTADEVGDTFNLQHGIVAVVGLPTAGAEEITEWVEDNELRFYFQSDNASHVLAVRRAADQAHLLGRRIFVGEGDLGSLHLADNVADAIHVSPSALHKAGDGHRGTQKNVDCHGQPGTIHTPSASTDRDLRQRQAEVVPSQKTGQR